MLEKRGQVTIFIILGIIILISAFLIYYITVRRVEVELPEKFIRETPEAILPIRYYVDDCIERVGREAVEEIGLHGGWIQQPDIASRIFDVSYDSTESDAVQFTLGGAAVPYWHYMTSSNDCRICQFSKQNTPTLDTMSSEINTYVDNRLQRCIRNFEPFIAEGFSIKKTGEIETSADIIEGIVLVKVKLPLQIEREGKSYTVEEFAVNLPVNLKKVYEMAMKVFVKEVNIGFLEHNMMNIISYTSSIDEDALPPIAASEIAIRKVFWSKTLVKQKLKELLITYLPLATIPGTHNFQIYRVDEGTPGWRLRQGVFMGFVFNILEGQTGFEDIDVSFNYLDWPIYFDITPSDGEIIKPDEFDANFFNLLPVFSRRYNFNYDISYPVVIELRDTTAFNREGYSFLFAVENNIRNNEVLTGNLTEFTKFGTPKGSLFADENQRISGEITITAFTGTSDHLPVEDAYIRYICGHDSVNLGQTDENGRFVSKFPLCIGGIVQVTKEGYYGDAKYLDAQLDVRQSIDVELYTLHTKKAHLKIRWPEVRDNLTGGVHGELSFSQLLNMINQQSKNRTINETVFLTISKVGENVDLPLNNILVFDKDVQELELQLVPGVYEVQAQYMWLPGVYITPETREVETGRLFDGTEEIHLPELNITPSPLGGAILNEETGYWIVKEKDLEEKNLVIFYILREKEPTKLEEIIRLANNVDLSKGWRSLVEPSWSK